MSQQELLIKVVSTLNELTIPYMVTGSIVSSLQGEPRSTHDIDVIVMMKSTDAGKIVKAFSPPDYYLDEADVRQAIDDLSMFNLLDVHEGDKVDFWLLTKNAFDVSRFQRRIPEDLFGHEVFVSTPEDTILAKLWWARLSGGSEKHLGDALSTYEVQYPTLDLDYVREWVQRLEVEDLYRQIRNSATTQ